MVKKDTKKKIALGTAAAVVSGAAAMAHPKVRKSVGQMGKDAANKAKDLKDDVQDKM